MTLATDFTDRTDKKMFHKELTEKIIGVFYDVYNELGHGFLESVYESAMLIALREAGLLVESQVEIPVWFREHKIGVFYADLLVGGVVIVELKAFVHSTLLTRLNFYTI